MFHKKNKKQTQQEQQTALFVKVTKVYNTIYILFVPLENNKTSIKQQHHDHHKIVQKLKAKKH